jgi:Tol biopolymer transport system component
LNTLDLNTGEMSPLPLIRDLGDSVLRYQYAASPDGSQLAYVSLAEDGSRQIFIGRVDGTGVRQQVTHDPIGAFSPAWSPDGTSIAYVGYGRGDAKNLFVLDLATGESTQVTDESPSCRFCGPHEPQFTPDGASLIYTRTVLVAGGGSTDLRTVPVAGGESTVLIGPGGGNSSLSPDGSLVTFLSDCPSGGGPCRYVANADGTDRRVIPGWEAIPAGTWSPDGTRIVTMDFLGELVPKSRQGTIANYHREIIVVTDVVTGEATRVAKGRAAIWLDDHTLLVEV